MPVEPAAVQRFGLTPRLHSSSPCVQVRPPAHSSTGQAIAALLYSHWAQSGISAGLASCVLGGDCTILVILCRVLHGQRNQVL